MISGYFPFLFNWFNCLPYKDKLICSIWLAILAGTVDLTVHEVTGGNTLKVVCKASRGTWEATSVDMAFEQFLEDITCNFSFIFLFDYLSLAISSLPYLRTSLWYNVWRSRL